MFKRFCKFFIIFAFVLPLAAALCMVLLWAFRSIAPEGVGAVQSGILSVIQYIPFANTAMTVIDAAFNPMHTAMVTTGTFFNEFLSVFFVGGVMYLIEGFLGRRNYKDSTQIFAKALGLFVGALILYGTNLFNELAAIVTRYTLFIIVIILVLIVSRLLFTKQRAFGISGIFKALLKMVINALIAVVLSLYLASLLLFALADPVAMLGKLLSVIMVFLVYGLFVSASLVVDALVTRKIK